MSAFRSVLEQSAALAGVTGTVEPYGGSLVIRGNAAGRGCEIGLGGQLLWVVVDTTWELPERAFVLWAPAGSYERTRMVHEDGPFVASGDPAFDAEYLVGGDEARLCVERLNESGWRALCAAAWARPGISWQAIAPPGRRRNICATVRTKDAHGPRGRTITPAYVAERVTALLAIADALERLSG